MDKIIQRTIEFTGLSIIAALIGISLSMPSRAETAQHIKAMIQTQQTPASTLIAKH